MAVRHLALDDALAAVDPRETDVDHVRVHDVQRGAEAHQEDRGREQGPNRPDRPGRPSPSAHADPDHPPEEVRERRVDERHRREDIADVEEVERSREGEEDEQVEVPHGGDASKVGQPDEEDNAESKPHPQPVDPSAEGTVVPARHLPRDLRPGPCLGDFGGLVVDLGVDDLARVGEVGPDLHRPRTGVLVESRLLRQPIGGIALDPVGDLRVGEDSGDRLLVGQLGRAGLVLGDERRPDEIAVRVVDGRLLHGGGRGRNDERREREEES